MKVKNIKMVSWFDEHFYQITTREGKKDVQRYLPSVTTHLQATPKPFLEKWRGDIGNREADRQMAEAAERGSRLHYAYSILPKGGLVVYNPPYFKRQNFTEKEINKFKKKYKENFVVLQSQEEAVQVWRLQQWFKMVKPKVLEIEKIVYSLKYGSAGTTDAVMGIKEGAYAIGGTQLMKLDGGLYIVDYKTGKVIDDDYFIQLSAYVKMYLEMHPEDTPHMKGAMIIHTNAKTKKGIEGLQTYVRTMKELEEDFKAYLNIKAVWERKNPDFSPKIFDFPAQISLEKPKPKKAKKKVKTKRALLGNTIKPAQSSQDYAEKVERAAQQQKATK